MMTRIKAFTLIELLVVISIIGILAALITASFVASQRQARDTQRKSDLSQYRTALEAYASANGGLYPTVQNGLQPVSSICSALTGFAGTCPEDPTPATRQYWYRSAASTSYFLYVLGGLESDTSKTWIVCSNGKSGTSATDWSSISAFCQ